MRGQLEKSFGDEFTAREIELTLAALDIVATGSRDVRREMYLSSRPLYLTVVAD
jgi:hypothetical protein